MSESDACAILEIAPDADGHVAEEDLKQVRHHRLLYVNWRRVQILKARVVTNRKYHTKAEMH